MGRRIQAGEGGLTSGQISACCQIKRLPLKRGVTCLPGASSAPWSEPLPGPGRGTHTPLGIGGCLPAWLLKAPSQEHAQARKYLFWGVARETVHLPQGCPCAQTGMPPALTVLGPHKHGQSQVLLSVLHGLRLPRVFETPAHSPSLYRQDMTLSRGLWTELSPAIWTSHVAPGGKLTQGLWKS